MAAEEEASFECDNCGRRVPEANRATHTSFCVRNNARCPECGAVVRRADLAQHTLDAHAPSPCARCGRPVRPGADALRHSERECPRRAVRCAFCSIPLEARDAAAHEEMCGARTAPCEVCGRLVRLRDMDAHLVAGCRSDGGVGNVIDDDGEAELDALRREVLCQPPTPSAARFIDATFERQLREARRASLAQALADAEAEDAAAAKDDRQRAPVAKKTGRRGGTLQSPSSRRFAPPRQKHQGPPEPLPPVAAPAAAAAAAAPAPLSPPRRVPAAVVQPSPRSSQMPTSCPWCRARCGDFEDLQMHMLTVCPLREAHLHDRSPQRSLSASHGKHYQSASPFGGRTVVTSFRGVERADGSVPSPSRRSRPVERPLSPDPDLTVAGSSALPSRRLPQQQRR